MLSRQYLSLIQQVTRLGKRRQCLQFCPAPAASWGWLAHLPQAIDDVLHCPLWRQFVEPIDEIRIAPFWTEPCSCLDHALRQESLTHANCREPLKRRNLLHFDRI